MRKNVLKALADSRSLPPGHYGRAEAQEAARLEYAEANRIESEYKKLNCKLSLAQMRSLLDYICAGLGVPPIRRLHQEFTPAYARANPYVGAYCTGFEIRFRNSHYITFVTGCHEIAHHVVNKDPSLSRLASHGPDFQFALRLALETGKDWLLQERGKKTCG